MDLGISGRVAVVTGASAGIGFAIAQEFVANGAGVVIAARGAARLKEAEARLLEHPGAKVSSVAVDISTPDAPSLIIDKAIETFGSLDILVNNAGRAHAGGLMTSSEEDWENMTDVKLTSMRRMCKAAIPHMQK